MHSGSIGDVIARGFVFASSGYVHLCVTARTDSQLLSRREFQWHLVEEIKFCLEPLHAYENWN